MDPHASTPLALTYLGPGGARTLLARGRIDPRGEIVADEIAAGVETWLAERLATLNALAALPVKTPFPLAGAPGAIAHRDLRRGAPEFLDQLKAYALTRLSLELSFDDAALAPTPSLAFAPRQRRPAPNRTVPDLPDEAVLNDIPLPDYVEEEEEEETGHPDAGTEAEPGRTAEREDAAAKQRDAAGPAARRPD